MVRKIALALLLTAAAGVASANTSSGVVCTTKYFLGIFPYEVCTVATPPQHVVAAPEISATSAVAGLTLVIGALAVLRGRRSRIAVAKA